VTDPIERLRAALADRYPIDRELGRGRMARVYLARDLRHGRPVALKVLHPALAVGVGTERFLREVRIAAALQHPHILPVHDSGEAVGQLYYVMPYVEGETLRARLDRDGPLPVDESVRLAREVLDALGYAHRHNVVHRDIKPENILLSDGHALVADFGIAKALVTAGDQRLTETGWSMGTPPYMSPEQIGAGTVDGRSDLYGLGCVLQEMLTGATPFTGATPQELFAKHVRDRPPPLRTLRPEAPLAVEQAIEAALAKAPEQRFRTAAEFATALGTPSDTRHGARPRPARAAFPRAGAMLVVGALVAVVAIGVVVMRQGSSPGLSLGKRADVTLEPGLEMNPAISPDGKMVAYSRLTTTGSAVMVQQLAGGAPVTVAQLPILQAGMPAWSPDGDRLLYLSQRGLEVVPALGGVSKLIVPLTPPGFVSRVLGWGSWAPDGQRIVYGVGDTLFTRALADSAPQLLVAGGQPNSPIWSPDGKWIAYVSGNLEYVPFANVVPSSIWVIRASGGTPVRITPDQPLNASPVWLPGSRHLLFISNQDGGRDIYRVQLNGSGAPDGPPVRLTAGLDPHTIALSSDGHRLVYSLHVETSNVFALTIQPGRSVPLKEARPVTSGTQIIEGFSVSSDGQWLAFDSNREGNQDIWRMPLDGSGQPEQLTTSPEDEFQPAYSADGMFLAFHQARNGYLRQLFIMPASGGDPVPVRTTTTNNISPLWAPTGQALAYNSMDAGVACIVSRRPNSRSWQETSTKLFPAGTQGIQWSPDGRWIAYAINDSIAVAPSDGGSPPRDIALPPGFSNFAYTRWAPDSRTIYFSGLMPDARFLVYAVSPTGGPLREVAHSDGPSFQTYRFSMDIRGNTLYLSLADRQSDIWMAEVEARP
jgi:serine/threonine-protein kinase